MDDASGTHHIAYADNGLLLPPPHLRGSPGRNRTRTVTMNRLGETVSVQMNRAPSAMNLMPRQHGQSDGVDNVITTINFDSLGRKTSMVDATKGTWSEWQRHWRDDYPNRR